MTPRSLPSPERNLARALKREAGQSEPAYSDLLHERIMAHIPSPSTQGERTGMVLAHRSILWPVLGLSAAAAMVLTVWIWDAPSASQAPSPVVSKTIPSLPPIGDLWAQVAQPAQSQLRQGQFAYLDRDAKRLAAFLIDQLPTAPDQPKY